MPFIPICHDNLLRFFLFFFFSKLENPNPPTAVSASAGKLMEYDEVMKLINKEGSLFGQLVNEYWSRASNSTAPGH